MRPYAAPAHFPYREHRTMAEVMLSERIEASHQRMLSREICFRCGAASGRCAHTPALLGSPISHAGGNARV